MNVVKSNWCASVLILPFRYCWTQLVSLFLKHIFTWLRWCSNYISGLPLNSFSVSRHLLLHLFHVRIFSENSSFSISLLTCWYSLPILSFVPQSLAFLTPVSSPYMLSSFLRPFPSAWSSFSLPLCMVQNSPSVIWQYGM